MYSIIRKALFQLPPEVAHDITLKTLHYVQCCGLTKLIPKSEAPIEVMGLKFPNPVGLAAGLDKNGECIKGLAALGFGFVEIGTVTPRPQVGNPQPRLFRLVEEEALINRMGFNNQGLDEVEERLQGVKFNGILGINVGKNKDTPLEKADEDYLLGFKRMAPYASYITINISSPNTPGLRDLQQGELLQDLLRKLKIAQAAQSKYVPLVVKVAPDLSDEEVQEMAEIFLQEKIDGLIATNTTLSRTGVENSSFAKEAGGLSGKPLFASSTRIVEKFNRILQNKIPIIACGGIFSGGDALEKIKAGASLVQVYTGLIYRGPRLIKEIVLRLQKS